MPNNTPKGPRAAIVVRIPVDLINRIADQLQTGDTPDRNSWIVHAIERKLADGRIDLHRE